MMKMKTRQRFMTMWSYLCTYVDVNNDMAGGEQVMCDVRNRAEISGKILKHMKPGTRYNLKGT